MKVTFDFDGCDITQVKLAMVGLLAIHDLMQARESLTSEKRKINDKRVEVQLDMVRARLGEGGAIVDAEKGASSNG